MTFDRVVLALLAACAGVCALGVAARHLIETGNGKAAGDE